MWEHPRPSTERRRSARLSAAAAFITAVILVWAVLANGDRTRWWLLWIATISFPVIVLSVAAAYQYGRGHGSGAGAAAAAVYWVLLVVFNVRAAPLYIAGALLQTVAWWIGRTRERDRPGTLAN